ncbi:MAG TPA: hypothetical protein VGH85_13815 [Mycobacteriales bacterium]|jgi:hypothetical protein
MKPEQGRLAQQGVAIVAAQLRGDHVERDQLIEVFVGELGFPKLAEAFSYAAVVAVELAANGQGISFQAALDAVDARRGVRLVPGATVPWTKAVQLVSAAKTDDRSAQSIGYTMDVHSAVNATFQLAVSAFLALEDTSGLGGPSGEEWASTVATGHAPAGTAAE